DGSEEDPDRVRSTEECDCDEVESNGRRDARRVETEDAEHLDGARDTGQQPGERHRKRGDEDRPHPGVARRARVLADRANLEPDRCPFEEPSHDEDGEHREWDSKMKVAPRENRKRAVSDVTGARE